jgi:hypothetical protein
MKYCFIILIINIIKVININEIANKNVALIPN